MNVGIIPTGSELVPLGVARCPGQVVESNTVMAEVFLSQMGARCTRHPIVPDDPDRIAAALRSAAQENDLVLISAGSPAGTGTSPRASSVRSGNWSSTALRLNLASR